MNEVVLYDVIFGGFFWLCGLMYIAIYIWLALDAYGIHLNKKKIKRITFFEKKSPIEKVYLIFKFTFRDPKLFFGVFSTKNRAENFVIDQKDWQMANCDIRLIDGLYYVLNSEYTHIDKICYSLEEAEANFKTDFEIVTLLECYVDNPSKDRCIKKYDDMEDPEVIKHMIRIVEETIPDDSNCKSCPFLKS